MNPDSASQWCVIWGKLFNFSSHRVLICQKTLAISFKLVGRKDGKIEIKNKTHIEFHVYGRAVSPDCGVCSIPMIFDKVLSKRCQEMSKK